MMQGNSLFSTMPFNTIEVTVNREQYKIHFSEVKGKMPIFIYGLGTLMRRTLSENFYHHFNIYSTDLYWEHRKALEDPASNLTIRKIIDDIQVIVTQLQLDKYILCGHSTFGIIALEAAKHDPRIAGVIMVGSPPNWNQHTWQTANQIFASSASNERKENDAKRRANYELVKKPNENECSINGYIRDTARYWKDFTRSDQFLKQLWEGVEADNAMFNVFFDQLLPNHHYDAHLEKIQCPVLLVGGPYDYDCVPLQLWQEAKKPKNFDMKVCPESGHWPNFEEPELFDKYVLEWSYNL